MNAYYQSREALRLLKCLPAEVLSQIISNLSNIDIKNLRQTCIYFKDIARPRINRLFLSTNLKDIQVFRAVADHEIYRYEVTEIIYDDVRFSHADDIDSESDYDADNIGDATGTPLWFRDVYRKLSQQQQATIATNRDADALKYGLSRLTNLRRVTITPAAHGVPGRPLYHTPAIRSLPQGILYPIERGWPVTMLGNDQLEEEDWNEKKAQWRGYFLVSRTLAQHLRDNPETKFTELVIDTNQLRTGISSRIFEEAKSSEKTDLITILSQPGFTRLDLSLYCGNQHEYDWCSFGSGRLRNLLANATDIQHISLFTNMAMRTEDEVDENFFPLRSIFPISDWHRLRHFGLSRFYVQKDDVIELLKLLPQTLMSVELSFLLFFPNQGNYQTLLEDMRDKLGWGERRLVDQPKIVVRVDAWFEPALGAILQDLSREVDGFVYHDGENPFEALEELDWLTNVTEGAGVLVDAFGPDYK
ncbi:uncharacterized protein B0J16DRAFT_9499 [Fusarium flagelliforme]|uniref:F-box domain-containing protein n=1 Tax=Fusarium flagelliforme TaxID=2675880 RepID=A0A395N743_9HYPO|nr:uncharacterized protein B0J16DRAFT_9499 [Fusarium flagelliforme]KAH7196949.1 hypothetical protein B0J16DRAFT_9499 [Fusarium flagelliforme]RFN55613.1 hypothetical protein FIE12Z_71 [Fusarium flagelliforme]